MIDFHSHFLPGIDDGAQTIEDSFKMLSESVNQGVTLCYATPHCSIHAENDIDDFVSKRRNALEALTEAAAKEGTALPQIRLGAEVYFDNDITRYEGYSSLCMEGTDYILLEFPMAKINPKAFDWIYEITLSGVKPVIAHIDRYSERDTIIGNLADLDVVYQINASRFISWTGKRIIRSILKHNHIKCIVATDMHNMKYRRPNLDIAYKKTLKTDPETARKFFEVNAGKFIDNQL